MTLRRCGRRTTRQLVALRDILFDNIDRRATGQRVSTILFKVSTIEGGTGVRTHAWVLECPFGADAHKRLAGGGLQRRGPEDERRIC